MAIALIDEDEVCKGIDVISLPSIDLRQFGGDELLLISQFSGDFPEANFFDIVVPTIDRSCFNESAGSRRQTYYNPGSSNKHFNRRLGLSATSATVIHRRSFGLTSTSRVHGGDGGFHSLTDELMPGAGTKSGIAKDAVRLTSDRKVTEKSSAKVAWKQVARSDLAGRGESERKADLIQDEEDSMGLFGTCSGEDFLWTESKERRTRNTTYLEMAKECRLSKNGTTVGVEKKYATNGGTSGGIVGIVTEPLSRKKFRQPMIQAFDDSEAEDEKGKKNRKKRIRSAALGQEGLVGLKRSCRSSSDTADGSLFESRQLDVNLRLENANGRTSEGYMMELLAKMKGKWSSSERTRKIVDASGFPVGWTVRVGLRSENGRTMFEYRDWRSPDGTLWSSFKDASAFLLASIRHDSTSEIVMLLEPGRGIICKEEMCVVEEKSTYEALRTGGEDLTKMSSPGEQTDASTIDAQRLSKALDETDAGKGKLSGGFCGKQFSKVPVDQSFGGYPSVDKDPYLTRPPSGVSAANYADKLISEENHRRISHERKTNESQHSVCFMRSLTASDTILKRHGCCDHMTKTILRSNEADVNESSSKFLFDPTWGMEFSAHSGHSKIKKPECCSGLLPCNASMHKCPSCYMMFSTLSKLRRHSQGAEHGRLVKCDVCGRHFSCIASLLGHRVKIGHPRVKRTITDSRRVQAKRLEAMSSLRGSKMLNIVLGLLSDTNGRCGCNVYHASVADKSASKSNPRSEDVPEIVDAEVRQDILKNGDISGTFECRSCDKVFYRRSQYWGHLSVHSKRRKKTPKPSALLESVSKRSSSRVVNSESNLAMVVRENCRCEAGNKYAVESVFWRLLNDSSSLEEHNHELDLFQDEIIVRPAPLHAKEEDFSDVILDPKLV